ncbi:MAG: Crp/Fnr family transcriptional regulator [Chitinophagaceae bacterium]|nr:Crp/Fnr family transcriptional regulator [Chitinophagaceae bacterium]MCW5925720.1 Crp/Fnr family transcriptional regulator [Chitinophagaceae bacterium]
MTIEFRDYLQTKTGITEEQYAQMEPLIVYRKIAKNTILLRQEAVCSEVYFVEHGLLRSYTVDEEDKLHVIQFAPEESWIGDRNSFYFGEPALFFIDAYEDSEVAVLDARFFEHINKIPEFAGFQSRILHNHIRLLQIRINMLMAASAEARYLDFVSRYPNLTLRVPQWMIASYLGITPESLSRVRKELARKNFRGDVQISPP